MKTEVARDSVAVLQRGTRPCRGRKNKNRDGVAGHLHRWAWLLLLATWVIVAHGCHAGDHDDELAIAPPPQRATSPE